MSATSQLHTMLLTELQSLVPPEVYGDIRRLHNLGWAVVGVAHYRSVAVEDWAEVVEGRARFAASRVRRLVRWLKNPAVQPARWYAPLLQHALRDLTPAQRLYVALDTTQLGRFVLIRAALIYRGRALPLAWRVLVHASATVAFAAYEPVLAQVHALLPHANIVLLADRGFYHEKLLTWAENHHWHYRIRVPGDTRFQLAGERWTVQELCLPPGQALFLQYVSVLAGTHPAVHVALGTPEDHPTEPWYIVSDEPTSVETFDEYGGRFDIEENFLDDKSNGFNVEASRLDDPTSLERLFLVLAVATLYFTSIGVGVVRAKMRRWVDTHWERGASYLKIGWRWVRQQVRRQWPRFAGFQLDLGPDPEPPRTTRQRALSPPRQWQVFTIDCKGAYIDM
jgi:hypothetical protein